VRKIFVDNVVIMWIFSIILFILLEIATPQLVTIWFAVGSIVAMIANIFGADIKLQFGLFLIVSIIMLAALRPIYKKYLKVNQIKTNVDAVIGTNGIVVKDIDNYEATGLVKVGGQVWSARSENGEAILSGEEIKVILQ